MGGRGTREEDGAEGRRHRHGRAREEEGEWGGGRRHEGGGKKYRRQSEGGENEKKIGGEHITVGSYYNPAVMLTYHRRFVIRPGGDVVESITAGSYYEPAVIRKHHRRVHLKPAVMGRWR